MSSVSTFGAFTMAKLGIYASQKAMQVTGNNITNVNTTGYTRQELELQSLYVGGADRYSSKWDMKIGSGVLVTGVNQIRSPYLDIRYRTEASNVGMMDTKLAGLNELSRIFDEVGDGEGDEGVMEAALQGLLEQLEYYSSEGAGKDEFDTIVRGSAEEVTSLFNKYAERLEKEYKNEIRDFRQDVDTVNSLLSNIQKLNNSIRKAEIHGGNALELKDERNLMIDDLAKFIRIDVTYEQEDVGSGFLVDKLVIKLDSNDINSGNDGAVLIDGKLATQLRIPDLKKSDEELLAKTPRFDVTLARLRDINGEIPQMNNPMVVLSDNDLYGSLQATRELLTEKGEFATDDDIAIDPDASIKRGIPYYRKIWDAMAIKFATVMNEANTLENPDGTLKTDAKGNYIVQPENYYDKDADGDFISKNGKKLVLDTTTPGSYKFYEKDLATGKPTATEVDVTDVAVRVQFQGGVLFSSSGDTDDTRTITAKNIAIAHSWSTGAWGMMQSRTDSPFIESTQNSNLRHMVSVLRDNKYEYRPGHSDSEWRVPHTGDKDGEVYFDGSFEGMLTKIASTLGNDTKITQSRLSDYAKAQNDLAIDRDSVSGVDLNDEAISMMQYNKSYSAACRLMTTLDQMLDKLINGTAV